MLPMHYFFKQVKNLFLATQIVFIAFQPKNCNSISQAIYYEKKWEKICKWV